MPGCVVLYLCCLLAAHDGVMDILQRQDMAAAPSLMASLGMPKTTQEASSWAKVLAPASSISRKPRAPSSPIPVMMMPVALPPANLATERNSTSTEGRWRLMRGPSITST